MNLLNFQPSTQQIQSGTNTLVKREKKRFTSNQHAWGLPLSPITIMYHFSLRRSSRIFMLSIALPTSKHPYPSSIHTKPMFMMNCRHWLYRPGIFILRETFSSIQFVLRGASTPLQFMCVYILGMFQQPIRLGAGEITMQLTVWCTSWLLNIVGWGGEDSNPSEKEDRLPLKSTRSLPV